MQQHRGALGVLGTITSMGCAAGTVISLTPEERITLRRGLLLTVLGFIFFISLSDLINYAALKTTRGLKFKKKYKLSISDILDISNKIVSAVQAGLSCVTGAFVCMWSCTRSLLHASHFMSEAYAWFGAAYFFYDIWSMYKVDATKSFEKVSSKLKLLNGHSSKKKIEKLKNTPYSNVCDKVHTSNINNYASTKVDQKTEPPVGTDNSNHEMVIADNTTKEKFVKPTLFKYIIGQPIIVAHHLFIGSFGLIVIVYLRRGLGDCVFSFVYLMELSTPFVSIRGILSKLGLKTSRLYVVNGLLMLITFFFCRITMLPYVCWMYSEVIGLPYWQAIWSLPRGCKISISCLLLPQLYWFYLMVKGAFKVFFITGKPAEDAIKSISSQARRKKYKKYT